MSRLHTHTETHRSERIGWLRAAVLGANDGIISTASLITGVAAAAVKPSDVLLTGVAGLVAGAMSMAAGEYVSVSSQSDTEQADLARERKELGSNVDFEREELAQIYVGRGVDHDLAVKVADQLMAKDALGAHARDELGISELTTALARQGVRCKVDTVTASRNEVAGVLLAQAKEHACDLIVMGGYGHWRLREIVFGGATRGILEQTTLPVLMSH